MTDAASPTLDQGALDALSAMVGGDPEAMQEIVEAFLEDAPGCIEELCAGAAAGDHEAARRAAHTLKSNARTFGAHELAELCQEIEAAARAGDLGPALARVGEVEGEWNRTRAALAALAAEAG